MIRSQRSRWSVLGLVLLLASIADVFHSLRIRCADPWNRALILNQQQQNIEGSSRNIQYRNARREDIPHIATLCSEVFEGPFPAGPFQAFRQQQSVQRFVEQISDRFDRFILQEKKHAMIVAADTQSSEMVLAGFAEIGTLPSPVATLKKGWMGIPVQTIAEVPYLGNVAVNLQFRRRGIASRLIRIAEKVTEKWGDVELYAAVESDNDSAVLMYEKLGFEIVLDERDLISRDMKRKPRLFVMKPTAAAGAVTQEGTEVAE